MLAVIYYTIAASSWFTFPFIARLFWAIASRLLWLVVVFSLDDERILL
jgi:hypothetical protein